MNAKYSELAQRLLPAMQELLTLSDGNVIELLIHAAELNAGIAFHGSHRMSLWSNLDHTHLAQGLWAGFKEELRTHIESGIDCHELCEMPGLAVHGIPCKPDFTHGELETLIDTQLRPHPDDVDETGNVIVNEY